MMTITHTTILACSTLFMSGLGLVMPASQTVWPVVANDLSSTAEGSIKSVDSGKKSFVIHTKDSDIEIQVTDTTVYTLNGKASTFQDAVMAGRIAVVSHTSKVAAKVDVTSSPSIAGID